MISNQISAFEYVSILVSIILGLGITQLLSSFSDLLYHFKKVQFYWPHTLWVIFILFLHIQDWFITYELKDKPAWNLPELLFILLYPIALFTAAKMLLPSNEREERQDMKFFYKSQYPIIFFIVSIGVVISILFNVYLLKKSMLQQVHLVIFLILLLIIAIKKIDSEKMHKVIAIIIFLASVLSIFLEKEIWVIK
jgi:hypothetical protein